jgi:hypothetical protein
MRWPSTARFSSVGGLAVGFLGASLCAVERVTPVFASLRRYRAECLSRKAGRGPVA